MREKFKEEIAKLEELNGEYKIRRITNVGKSLAATATFSGPGAVILGPLFLHFFAHTNENRIKPIEMILNSLKNEEKDIKETQRTFFQAYKMIQKNKSKSKLNKELRSVLEEINQKLWHESATPTAYYPGEGLNDSTRSIELTSYKTNTR